jgi:hypothetical protein
MAFTILSHFRNVCKYGTEDISDTLVRTDYFVPALALYNAIMDTSLTITDDTTGVTTSDTALAWLAASLRYSEDRTTSRDRLGRGLLEWELWEQRAFGIMAAIDGTKFEFSKGNHMWSPKQHDHVWVNMARRNDAEDTETYGG